MKTQMGMAAAVCLTLGVALAGAANAQAELSISPANTTEAPGNTFSVDVNVSNVTDLYGYQFDVLFNPNVISAVSSSEGSFLSKGGSTFFIPGTNDNVGGAVSATANTLISPVPGVSGSGSLVSFTFEAIKAGISNIAISGAELIDSAFNSIATTSTSAAVSVSSGGRMNAPEIDPASAVSALTLLFGAIVVLLSRSPKPNPLKQR